MRPPSQANTNPPCRLDEGVLAVMIRGITSALCFLHEDHSLIHRDLKPGNVVLGNKVLALPVQRSAYSPPSSDYSFKALPSPILAQNRVFLQVDRPLFSCEGKDQIEDLRCHFRAGSFHKLVFESSALLRPDFPLGLCAREGCWRMCGSALMNSHYWS